METVGTVAELWRYPVKSMLGERVESSEVSERGLAGDRAYALLDAETGKLVSAKRPRMWGRMFEFRSSLPGAPDGPARITFPGGSAIATDEPDADRMLSEALGRKVTVVSTTNEYPILEEVWIEEKQADPYGAVVGTEDANPLIEIPSSVGAPLGTFFDYSPIHLVTSGTLDRLAGAYLDGRFDVRRFRPNLLVDVAEDAFVENDWIERVLRIGDTAKIEVVVATPRCVMTTLPQADLPKDTGILRTAAQINRLPFGPFGDQPCVGVYAQVLTPGTIRVSDPVHLE